MLKSKEENPKSHESRQLFSWIVNGPLPGMKGS